MRHKILIYADYGCADVTCLQSELKEYFEPRGCEVGLTDAAGIIRNNDLSSDVLAFFLPGGAGTPYRRKLEVLGNDKIREYVASGGIYYGICAGAYYACRQTIFENDIPELRIVSECGLNLVEGQAIGTLYKELNIRPYDKNAASSAVVGLVWQDNQKFAAHYHGGPYFEGENIADADVLARYDLPSAKPAIISQNYGRGKVILSGVHYENKGETLARVIHKLRLDEAEAQHVAQELTAAEPLRKALFDKLMSQSELA